MPDAFHEVREIAPSGPARHPSACMYTAKFQYWCTKVQETSASSAHTFSISSVARLRSATVVIPASRRTPPTDCISFCTNQSFTARHPSSVSELHSHYIKRMMQNGMTKNVSESTYFFCNACIAAASYVSSLEWQAARAFVRATHSRHQH